MRLKIESLNRVLVLMLTIAVLMAGQSVWAQYPASIGSIQYNSTLEAYEINCVANLNDLAVYVNGTGTYSTSLDETTAHSCEGMTFKQTADITYTGTDNYTPIGLCVNDVGFRGTFDGQSYTISGIDCTGDGVTGENESLGLFGQNWGTIRNVTLSGCRFASANNENNGNNNAMYVYIGSIAGNNNYTGTISNCTVTGGTVSRTRTEDADIFETHIGGISGDNTGSITGCTYSGSVSGTYSGSNISYGCTIHIGGIVGISKNGGSITGCGSDATVSFSTPNVSAPNLNVGGIAGVNNGAHVNATISDCFFSGPLNGTGGGNTDYIYIGAFVGESLNSSIVTNNYYYGDYATTTGTEPGTGGILDNLVRVYQFTATAGITATAPEGSGTIFKGVSYFKTDATVTLAPQAGYVLTAASYNDGTDHANTPDNGVYTFSMPASNVTVSAVFEAIPWSGTGDKNDPYVIQYPSQLDLLATNVNDGTEYKDKYFVLANDIAYTHTTDWDDATSTENNYTPIGGIFNNSINSFKGTFDGQGHTVSGIRIYPGGNNTSDDSNLGLFGYVGSNGTVRNVTVADARITGFRYVGGIVGNDSGGKIVNCHATSTVALYAVNDGASNFGGIAGYNNKSTISFCSTAATLTIKDGVTGCYHFGGIMGRNSGNDSSVRNCLVFGATIPALHRTDQNNDYDASGAIVGYNSYNGALENNYYSGCTIGTATSAIGVGNDKNSNDRHDVTDNDGAVPGTLHTLTLGEHITAVGALINQSGTISAAEGSAVRLSYSGAGDTQIAVFSLNDTELVGNYFIMPSADGTVSANLVTAWGVDGGANGSEQNPYVITRSAELDLLAKNVNGGNDYQYNYFVLGADIAYNPAAIDVNGDNYTAIGASSQYSFSGSFDGRGHTISGIRINQANNSYQGLFGRLTNGTVKNVTLSDARITGNYQVGGIVGHGGTIENCLVIGTNVTCNNYGGVIGGSTNTLRHNYYSDSKRNNSNSNIGTSGGDRSTNDGAVPAKILSDVATTLPTLAENDKVVFRRLFTAGKASTVCLPFDYTPGSEGDYYTFSGITKENGKYVATMTEAASGTLAANTPYLFMPAGTEGSVPVTFIGMASDLVSADETTSGDWTFTGTYTRLTYGTAPMTGHIYGFAAKSKTVDGHEIEAGDFVHAKEGASVPPMRCYLTYKNGAQLAPMRTSALGATGNEEEIPSRITVKLVSSGGVVTSVGTLDMETGEVTVDIWYDMSGRPQDGEPTAPGLYIHNGKTIMIKQ